MLALAAGVILTIYSANITASFGLVDDHEILEWTGPDGRLSWTDLQRDTVNPVVWTGFNSELRFRPSYSLLRMTEIGLWGANPQPWYLARMGFLLLFFLGTWRLSKRVVGFTGGFFFTFSVIAATFWSDVVCGLGTGEAYAGLGIGLLLLGMDLVWEKCQYETAGWALVTAGVVIGSGAKENMIILWLPLAVLVFNRWRRHELNRRGVVAMIVSTLWVIFITAGVLKAVSGGINVYQKMTSFSSTLNILIDSLRMPMVLCLYVTILGSIFVAILAAIKQRRVVWRASWVIVGLNIGLLALVFIQRVVYQGVWPFLDHYYNFPGMLFLPVWGLGMLWFANVVWKDLATEQAGLEKVWPVWRWLVLGLCVALALTHFGEAGKLREYSVSHANQTNQLQTQIKSAVEQLAFDPQAVLVLESNDPYDFERLRSYVVFLQVAGMKNPISVHWSGPEKTSLNEFEANLYQKIQSMAAGMTPLPNPQTQVCFSLAIKPVGKKAICPLVIGTK
jgi:hypothetical protein